MTQAFTASRLVDGSTEHVWARLTDWDRAAGWLGVDSVRAEGPTTVGTQLWVRTRGKERPSRIVAVASGRLLTLRSQQGGVTADYTYTVEPDVSGSRVTLVADVVTHGAWKLAGPAIRAAIRRTDAKQLDALDRELAAG